MDPSIPLSLIWWHLHLPHFTSSDLQITSKLVFYVPIVTHSQSGRSFWISVCRWLFWQIDEYFECTPNVFSIQVQSTSHSASIGYTICGKDGMCYYQKKTFIDSIQIDVRVRTNVYAGNRHLFVDNTVYIYADAVLNHLSFWQCVHCLLYENGNEGFRLKLNLF